MVLLILVVPLCSIIVAKQNPLNQRIISFRYSIYSINNYYKKVSLLKTISGTRGTIGGKVGNNLTAQDLAESAAAYAQWLANRTKNRKIIIGRDARISGEVVAGIVINTLRMMGFSVVDLGLSTTPTVEIAVPAEEASGGIILTASHNPKQWNALKFLNEKGEFISAADGATILELASTGDITYAQVDDLGEYQKDDSYIQKHIDLIMALPLVNAEAVKAKSFKIVVDCVNSTGAISIVPMLEQMGCEVVVLHGDNSGKFAHNPEPLPEHLTELSRAVLSNNAQLGVAVDPDVDRLALVSEDGEMFGEEYTLVAVADYILKHTPGNTVSNLSSTIALKKITEERHKQSYAAAPVGEVNVVEEMKRTNAVIGGEGNGGIIYPALHYGRDAMAGLALFLTHLADFGKPVSFLRRSYPNFIISKNKIQLEEGFDTKAVLKKMSERYARQPQDIRDGVKIYFDEDWVHLRLSNTEPIIRIYAESTSEVAAAHLANKIQADIKECVQER